MHEQPQRTTIAVRLGNQHAERVLRVADLDTPDRVGDLERQVLHLAHCLRVAQRVVHAERRRAGAAEARVQRLQEHNLQLLAHVERLRRRAWWPRLKRWWSASSKRRCRMPP